jgi:hypothetical protein
MPHTQRCLSLTSPAHRSPSSAKLRLHNHAVRSVVTNNQKTLEFILLSLMVTLRNRPLRRHDQYSQLSCSGFETRLSRFRPKYWSPRDFKAQATLLEIGMRLDKNIVWPLLFFFSFFARIVILMLASLACASSGHFIISAGISLPRCGPDCHCEVTARRRYSL